MQQQRSAKCQRISLVGRTNRKNSTPKIVCLPANVHISYIREVNSQQLERRIVVVYSRDENNIIKYGASIYRSSPTLARRPGHSTWSKGGHRKTAMDRYLFHPVTVAGFVPPSESGGATKRAVLSFIRQNMYRHGCAHREHPARPERQVAQDNLDSSPLPDLPITPFTLH